MWLNEYEVDDAQHRFDPDDTPNLLRAARILRRLVQWTNHNSDGWPYWQKPAKAAGQLMELIYRADRFDPQDVTEAELSKALRPIKAFLTRQGVQHDAILSEPVRDKVSETGEPYVPKDYDGPIDRCQVCGNPAPVRKILLPGSGMQDVAECSPCFIGGVVIATVSPAERANLILNVEDED